MIKEIMIDLQRFRPTGIRNYWVSEFGYIVNLDSKNLQMMTPQITKDGHLRIELYREPGVSKKYFIHRLVYKAFVGKLKKGYVIEHLDSNPQNNHYTNLKQSTQKENVITAVKFGSFHNNRKKLIIYDRISKVYMQFKCIKEALKFFNIYGDSLYRLKRAPRFTNRYDIIVSGIKGQSTIETVVFNAVKTSNGVEYLIGEIQ